VEPRRRPERAAVLAPRVRAALLAILLASSAALGEQARGAGGPLDVVVDERPVESGVVPPLPLPGRPADPERLREARSIFTAPPIESALGRYPLLTDIDDRALLERLARVTDEIEPLYLARYGVAPVGDPAETIVLYRSESSYRDLQGRSDRIRGLASRGHVGWGMVVLYADAGPVTGSLDIALRHELGHVLNRRSLGPALPPWLDEGLADDFAAFELGPGLAPRESSLQALRRVEGNRIDIWGALAGLDRLSRALASGAVDPLRAIFELDWRTFVDEPAGTVNYAASAWLVRYLLDPLSGYDAAFRSFLRQVAQGGGVGVTDLAAALGSPWSEIERGWRRYVAFRAAAAGVGPAPL
jgi:hypothetical protein